MDTTVMEYTAEDLIAHKLQRSDILVAKPKFDREGADLLALLDVSDGAKFCRIQCKGRSLTNSKRTQVKVPKKYVTDAFVLFLFVETGVKENTHLFCFLGNEIRNTWNSKEDTYELSITTDNLEKNFTKYIFNEGKINQIKKMILNVDVQGEFRKIIHGYLDATLEPITLKARGTVSNSKK